MYQVQVIGPDERDELFAQLEPRLLYSRKCDIYGCCIKLQTDTPAVKDRYEDNFYVMSESVRSHGKLIVIREPGEGQVVKYEPLTRTAFLFNIEYYGWIKSLALALAGDILEDEHDVYSVHGAAIDVNGRGISLIAPSKTGKTTHSWGLLRMEDARLVTDDWYFVRLSSKRPLAFGSEKNFYVEGDIATIWPEYLGLVEGAEFDDKGRAIVNVRWTVGQGGVVPLTTMYSILLLKRDEADERGSFELSVDEALEYLMEHSFCNPHQLIKNERKTHIRSSFFRRFLSRCEVHMVNTARAPQETQEIIRQLSVR